MEIWPYIVRTIYFVEIWPSYIVRTIYIYFVELITGEFDLCGILYIFYTRPPRLVGRHHSLRMLSSGFGPRSFDVCDSGRLCPAIHFKINTTLLL